MVVPMNVESEVQEAVEVVMDGAGDAPLVLTCEHASNRMPPPWFWPDQDQWIIDTHWAIDLGVAAITRGLAAEIGANAVLARYSRLLIDPNRSLTAPSLFRQFADGKRIHMNLDVDEADARRRIDQYWTPYHTALERVLVASPSATVILAMHSFTPVYEGNLREMEIGVLFDHSDALAQRMAESLADSGLRVALNEPYSGRNGMMFAAYRHGQKHDLMAIELEIRQDLSGDPARQPMLIKVIAKALADAQVL